MISVCKKVQKDFRKRIFVDTETKRMPEVEK